MVITIPLMSFYGLFYWFALTNGTRIQGLRNKAPLIAKEAFGSSRAMLVISCMVAWPAGLYFAGYNTGLDWTVEEMGLNWWMVILQMYGGIIAIDSITY